VIDTLLPGNVLVVDLFSKIEDGTFIGDNLGTAIAARAGTGLVVDGGIRDLERVYQLPDCNVFCRGCTPPRSSMSPWSR
jgi:4-hydroxy-4-methyl-2-oxoglutarate aldolase